MRKLEAGCLLRIAADGSVHEERWSMLMAAGKGYQGPTFHVGFERRPAFGAIRAGVFYTSGQWQPTGGFAVKLNQRLKAIPGVEKITRMPFSTSVPPTQPCSP